MAFDRSERGHRLEQYPQRGDSERDRRDRGHEDSEFYNARETDDEADYARPSGRRHWRGHDYFADEEFGRGRDYRPEDRLRQAPLSGEHRDRFLRGGSYEDRYGELWPRDWRRRDNVGDEDRWAGGPYAGRGPKGYRRSDERIHENICERLTEHPAIDASDIEVVVASGDVTLTGRVESRPVKHLTEVMTETVPGVKEVHNQLRVAPLEPDVYPSSEEVRETRGREPRRR